MCVVMHMNINNGLVAFDRWRREIGISRSTAWRWRCAGWIKTYNINSRLFVDPDEVAEFVAVAKSGRFARRVRMPVRKSQRAEQTAAAEGESA